MAETYYDLLGVHPQASAEAITRSWKLAALRNHPDRWAHEGHDSERAANDKMAAINQAYQTLSVPSLRRSYDLEHGLIPARCTECGAPGALRAADGGRTVAYCEPCLTASLA